MKRLLALIWCMCLLVASAFAENQTVMTADEDEDVYRWVSAVAPVENEVYMLTKIRDEGQLWCWRAGQKAVQLAEGLVLADCYDSMESLRSIKAGSAAELEHAVSALFSDGKKLYGFNHLNGLVYTITTTETGLVYEDVVTIRDTRAIYEGSSGYYISPIHVIKAGDWMLWFGVDYTSRNYTNRLLAFNLQNGAVKQAVLPTVYAASSYKEGMALLLCNPEADQDGSYALYSYDPQTDVTECLGQIPRGVSLGYIGYSESLDRIVYQDDTRIMGWTTEGTEQLGYVPTAQRVRITVAGDTLLYAMDDQSLSASSLQRGYSTEHSLNILGGRFDNVLSQFYIRHQDIPFYYLDRTDATNAERMADEEDVPDLVYVNADEFKSLLEGRYLLDLSAFADLTAFTDVLYPVYKEFISQDGGVYGIPVYAASYDGWYINKAVMQDMGLTEADIPTTLTGLCEFATKWNNEYAEKYPHYTLLNNTADYRERIFFAMLEGWCDYCQYAGKELTLEDPVFREMLAALDAAELDKLNAALQQTDPEVSEYKQALIWTGLKDVGNWANYMEPYSDRIFLPITLTADVPYTAAVESLSLWVVNAKTTDAEYAAALLAEHIAMLNDTNAYVLRSDMTKPIERKSYAASIAQAQETLASLESRLKESANRATIEARIAEQQAYINTELARQRYEINPTAIENYIRVIAPASFIALPDGLSTSDRTPELTELMYRYIGGSLSAEELIAAVEEQMK